MFLFRIIKFFNIFYEVECFFVYQHYNCSMWKTNRDKIQFQELSHLRSFRWHDDDFFFMDIFPDWMIGKGRFFWLRSHCPAFIVFHCSVLMWKLDDEVSETQREMIISIFLYRVLSIYLKFVSEDPLLHGIQQLILSQSYEFAGGFFVCFFVFHDSCTW